jgi:Tfp pilus assembly protein PilF
MPNAAHFIYIPGVLLVGIVIGWILGSRAAADAYAAQLRRLSPNAKSQTPNPKSQIPNDG